MWDRFKKEGKGSSECVKQPTSAVKFGSIVVSFCAAEIKKNKNPVSDHAEVCMSKHSAVKVETIRVTLTGCRFCNGFYAWSPRTCFIDREHILNYMSSGAGANNFKLNILIFYDHVSVIAEAEATYRTTSSILFLYTPSSLSAGKPIAIMFG